MSVRGLFSSNQSFASSSVNWPFTIAINPMFDAFAANAGVSMSEDYEELIAHESGFHNMMGQIHSKDKKGNAIYPKGITLESNNHNKILSSDANTMQLLTTNITNRIWKANYLPTHLPE
jgi:hypothetical protein